MKKAINESDEILTGFPTLDRITGGLRKKDVVFIASKSATARTSFALSLMQQIAVEQNIGVAYFPLGISSQQLFDRWMTSETEIVPAKMKYGNEENDEKSMPMINKLISAPVLIDDAKNMSVPSFCNKCRQLVQSRRTVVFIIDYLQLMSQEGIGTDNNLKTIRIMTLLKSIAEELNVVIVVLSRIDHDTSDKRPRLDDLQDADIIQKYADSIIFIHHSEHYGFVKDEKNESLHGIAEMIVVKNRNHVLERIRLIFKNLKYEELDEESDRPIVVPINIFGIGERGCRAVKDIYRQELSYGKDVVNCHIDSEKSECADNDIDRLPDNPLNISPSMCMTFILIDTTSKNMSGLMNVIKSGQAFNGPTIAIVITSFPSDDASHLPQSQEIIWMMNQHADIVFVFDNQSLSKSKSIVPPSDIQDQINNLLVGIIDNMIKMVTVPRQMTIMAKDMRANLKGGGYAAVGIGIATGKDRAFEAVKKAISMPTFSGGLNRNRNRIVLYIKSSKGKYKLSMDELRIITDYIDFHAGNDVEIVWHTGYDETLNEALEVFIMAIDSIEIK